MLFVYILECADGSYYVGSTTDLDKRLAQHNEGQGSAYTRPRRRRPVQLKWSTEYESIQQGYDLEKRLQGWSRAKREALMEGRFEDLPALSRSRQRRTDDAVETTIATFVEPVETVEPP